MQGEVKVNYRKEFEKTARSMILVHNTKTLARIVVKNIVKNTGATHACVFLLDKNSDEFIVKVSQGAFGVKLPENFAKLKADNPIIKYFRGKKYLKQSHGFFILEKVIASLKNGPAISKTDRSILSGSIEQAKLYGAQIIVPGYFGEDLILLIVLGNKTNSMIFTTEELSYLSVLSSDIVMAFKNTRLFEDLSSQVELNKKLFLNTVTAFSNAIEAKDQYTLGHTSRVVDFSLAIAKHLDESISSDKAFMEKIRISALLHDIGKIGISENILNKKGPLTIEERKIIEMHPEIGFNIIKHIKEFDDVSLGVKYHHEYCNGKGYPTGLSGKDIPLIATIISVADCFDAMTSDRPYRKALPLNVAIKEITDNSGKQFTPKIVDAFLLAIKSKDIK